MNLKISGHHLAITPAIRDYLQDKLAKVSRHFEQVMDVDIILSVDKLDQKAEAKVHLSGKDLFCESIDAAMDAAIDGLADKLDRAVLKHKEKLVDHHRGDQHVGSAEAEHCSGECTTETHAFVWAAATGTRRLARELEQRGVDLADWQLISAVDVSADGSVIVGVSPSPIATNEAFKWTLTDADSGAGTIVGLGDLPGGPFPPPRPPRPPRPAWARPAPVDHPTDGGCPTREGRPAAGDKQSG